MAKAGDDSTRGKLLAEAFKTYIAKAGGHLALAKDRLRADIVNDCVSVSGENRDGTPFESPTECPWREAAYDLRRSTARWLNGPKPVYANPLAGKVPPADTRRTVVAYAVRLISMPTQPEAVAGTLTATQASQTVVTTGGPEIGGTLAATQDVNTLTGEPASHTPPNRGGRPEVWDWPDLAERLRAEPQIFETQKTFVDHCKVTVLRVDRKRRGDGPIRKAVNAAIRKHGLDKIPGIQILGPDLT